MRTAIVAAVLLLCTAARAEERPIYVDLDRAVTECSDGKKATADVNAQWSAFLKATNEAKAKNKPLPNADQERAGLQQKWNEASAPIRARMLKILPAIAKARKRQTILPAGLVAYMDPALDVTPDLVKRYDAGEAKEPSASAAEIKALRDRLATLEAQRTPAKVQAEAKPGAR